MGCGWGFGCASCWTDSVGWRFGVASCCVGLLLSRFCFEQALLSIQPPPSNIELAVLFSPTMLSIIGTHRAAIDSYSSCSRFSFPAAATLYSEARKHDTQLKYEMPSTHERYS
jgi:hypothetical protein